MQSVRKVSRTFARGISVTVSHNGVAREIPRDIRLDVSRSIARNANPLYVTCNPHISAHFRLSLASRDASLLPSPPLHCLSGIKKKKKKEENFPESWLTLDVYVYLHTYLSAELEPRPSNY